MTFVWSAGKKLLPLYPSKRGFYTKPLNLDSTTKQYSKQMYWRARGLFCHLAQMTYNLHVLSFDDTLQAPEKKPLNIFCSTFSKEKHM